MINAGYCPLWSTTRRLGPMAADTRQAASRATAPTKAPGPSETSGSSCRRAQPSGSNRIGPASRLWLKKDRGTFRLGPARRPVRSSKTTQPGPASRLGPTAEVENKHAWQRCSPSVIKEQGTLTPSKEQAPLQDATPGTPDRARQTGHARPGTPDQGTTARRHADARKTLVETLGTTLVGGVAKALRGAVRR